MYCALAAGFQTYWTQLLFRLLLVSSGRGMVWARYWKLVAMGVAAGGAVATLWEIVMPSHMEYGLLYFMMYVLTFMHFLCITRTPVSFTLVPDAGDNWRVKTNSKSAASFVLSA